MATKLRRAGVAAHYSCDPRTVDRMRRDGRIPPPKYLPGSRVPLWDADELNAHDRAATLTPPFLDRRAQD